MYKKIRVGILIALMLLINIPFTPTLAESIYPIEYRGSNFINTQTGPYEYVWESAPQWVLDGSEYVPYIFEEIGNYFKVQSGLISAELYSNKAVFYDRDMTRLAVGRETWLVYQNVGGDWVPVCASLTPYFDSSDVSLGLNDISITGTWSTGKGVLSVEYNFNQVLKHTVTWTPTQAGSYAIVQVWNETAYTHVELGDGTVIDRRTDDFILGHSDSLTFLFYDDTEPFGVFEDQYSARDMLHKVLFAKGTVNYQGITLNDAVAWVFFNSSQSVVGDGESITIDPATYTDGPDYDITVKDDGTKFEWNMLMCGVSAGADVYRSMVRFDVTAIPDSAFIHDVSLALYCGLDGEYKTRFREAYVNRTFSVVGATLYIEAGNGTQYGPSLNPTAGTWSYNDLGVSADADLTINLVNGHNFFAVGMQSDTEAIVNHNIQYTSSNPGPAFEPKLTVIYNPAPSITSAVISDMDDGDNCYEMKDYYTFVATIENGPGADKITNVSLRIMDEANVLAEVNATSLDGAPAFVIVTGATIIDLDTGSCSWGEAGTTGTATFKIRFEWDFVDIADLELSVYAMNDDEGVGWTEMASDYFDVIGRLLTDGMVANATYYPLNGGVQITGTVYYATSVLGNTPSAIFPPDAQFNYVSIHNVTHGVMGNDTGVVNGEFSVDFTGPGTIGTYTYHAYINMTGDYVAGDAPDADIVTIYVISAALMLPFDEEYASIANDWGGQNNDGTIYGAEWENDGLYGRALTFNGSTDYVQIPGSASLNISTSIFISAWIRTSDTGVQGILYKNGSYGLSVLSNYAIRFTLNTTNLDTGPNMFTADTWTFVAGRCNGSVMDIIIDGVSVANQAFATAISVNNTDIFIGNYTTNFFNGTIDEIRILSSAPSIVDVIGLMWDPIATFPYNLQASITDMEAENWIFVDDRYDFSGIFVRQNSTYPLDTVQIGFYDGVYWTTMILDLITDTETLISSGTYLVTYSDSSEGNTFTVVWELYIAETIFDELNVDIWMECDDTLGNTDTYAIVMVDYFNIYNRGGITQYDSMGDAGILAGEGVFGLIAGNSSDTPAGSWAYTNVTWKNLQHVGMITHLFQYTTWDAVNGYWNCPTEHAGTGYVQYGVDYWVNDTLTTGWYVNITITDGAAGTFGWGGNEAWVALNVSWYNQGVYKKSDIIYAYYEAIKSSDQSTQFALYIDLWFGDLGGSSVVCGNVRPQYFGMNETGWGPWASWSPIYGLTDESSFADYLYDNSSNIVSAERVELMTAWANLTKSDPDAGAPDCDSHYWALRDYTYVWRRIPPSEIMYGINPPEQTPAVDPDDPSPPFAPATFGMWSELLSPLIAGAASTPFFFVSALLDSSFLFFGIGGFTSTATTMITSFSSLFIPSMLNITFLMIQMFRIITGVSGFMINWVTRMVSFFILLSTTVQNILSGTQAGIGSIVNIWDLFEVNTWLDFIPIAVFVSWIAAIDNRAKKMGGGWLHICWGDLQMAQSMIAFVVDWSFRLYHTVMELVFRMMDAIPRIVRGVGALLG